MTSYIRQNNAYYPMNHNTNDVSIEIPPGFYLVLHDLMQGFYLEHIDTPELPGVRYGKNDAQAHRIFTTFQQRSRSTGVILAGEKGSGKSLLAKTIGATCLAQGIPTLLVTSPWAGDEFSMLLQTITQPCMVLFDEFEKTYTMEDQHKLLTLFDGVFFSKKLFVLTVNTTEKITNQMLNRPGRFYYLLEFEGIEEAFVREYCLDNLQYQEYLFQICALTQCYAKFNFDMLQALVEEINRYNESPEKVMAYLNIKPSRDDERLYHIELTHKGIPCKPTNPEWRGNPLAPRYHALALEFITEDEDGKEEWKEAKFESKDLVRIRQDGTAHFQNQNDFALTLSPIRIPPKSYFAALYDGSL